MVLIRRLHLSSPLPTRIGIARLDEPSHCQQAGPQLLSRVGVGRPAAHPWVQALQVDHADFFIFALAAPDPERAKRRMKRRSIPSFQCQTHAPLADQGPHEAIAWRGPQASRYSELGRGR